MEIFASSVVHHPPARVYRAYRDELTKIAAYMPNVKGVVVKERNDTPTGVRLHNVWTGKGEVPRIAQGVFKPEYMVWDDYAEWFDADTHCEWRIGLRVFNDQFSCRGTNQITAEGPHSRVTLRGDLLLDLRDIPGVPRLVAGTLRPQLEAIIVRLIRPNLEETNAALGRYLSANP